MKKKEDNFTLPKEKQDQVAYLLQNYLDNNFDIEISSLQASILTDFITENIGSFYYNRGVEDSMVALKDKVDDLFLLMKD